MTRPIVPVIKTRNDCIQTPIEVAQKIVNHFNPTGKILEPCKGAGNFLKVLPEKTEYCEILEGIDFFNYHGKVDWIITNPPYSLIRKFMNKSMSVADNVVFLTLIAHLWFKARLRDVFNAEFGIKEIVLLDTPKTFPQMGFQIGCFYLKRGYVGDIKFQKL